jgi:hypothetical protein
MRFWVYFVGTYNGAWIEAADMAGAKAIFAMRQGVPMSGYIKASRKAPVGARELESQS